jgi:hypothetical protein
MHFIRRRDRLQLHLLQLFTVMIDGQHRLSSSLKLNLNVLKAFGDAKLDKLLELGLLVQGSSRAGNNLAGNFDRSGNMCHHQQDRGEDG